VAERGRQAGMSMQSGWKAGRQCEEVRHVEAGTQGRSGKHAGKARNGRSTREWQGRQGKDIRARQAGIFRLG